MTVSVARAPRRRTTGRRSCRSASASRAPCRNSIGTSTSNRWPARSSDGRPAGWSGKPRNTRPRTAGSGDAAWACEVMRPPNDLPPAMMGRAGRKPVAAGNGGPHGGLGEPGRIGPPARPVPCRGTDSAGWRRRARPVPRRCGSGTGGPCRLPLHAPSRRQARGRPGRQQQAGDAGRRIDGDELPCSLGSSGPVLSPFRYAMLRAIFPGARIVMTRPRLPGEGLGLGAGGLCDAAHADHPGDGVRLRTCRCC